MDIYPHRICGEEIPFRAAGKKIRALLEEHWKDGDVFVIRFEGRPVDSVSFFDEAFALLLRKGMSMEDLKTRLQFPDIAESDRMLLNFAFSKRLDETLHAHHGSGLKELRK